VQPSDIRHYRDQGYALISGLFTARELDAMEAAFDGILERRRAANAELNALWPGKWREQHATGTEVLHTHDVQAYSAVWSRALTHPRLTRAMSRLMGSPNVQLHHTKMFLKPPEKGGAFPMHQDHPYFPHERHTMMAAIIHLTDATRAMGCVRVVPGSHKHGPLPTHEHNHLDPAEWPVESARALPAKRGDVLFFNYLTVHGSGPNTSRRTRKTVLIQVRDPADRPLDEQHRSHAQGMILHGIHPLEDTAMAEGTLEG
jgi:hypothetical protein